MFPILVYNMILFSYRRRSTLIIKLICQLKFGQDRSNLINKVLQMLNYCWSAYVEAYTQASLFFGILN